MAKEPFRTKVIVHEHADGQKHLSCYDPLTGREFKASGALKGQYSVDQQIRATKEQLERAGNRVEVKEVRR